MGFPWISFIRVAGTNQIGDLVSSARKPASQLMNFWIWVGPKMGK